MSKDTYYTISANSEGQFKDKGSKFIALAFPVSSEMLAKERVEEIRKQHHGARHHCYAYRVGTGEPYLYRMNDDGEPSGTAGKPIYGQILSRDLTNLLIVVVRYFGGILLGTSGLIKAYKKAAEDALNRAEIIQKIICEKMQLQFQYGLMNKVMRIVREESIEIAKQDFQTDCVMEIWVRKNSEARVIERFASIDKLNITKI